LKYLNLLPKTFLKMKRSFFAVLTILLAIVNTVSAQKQAQPDNGQYITVEQSTGANHQVHYKLTNKNSVAMDFSLYKRVSNGSWDITRHLNLQPGEVYDDVNSFTGLTGKYVVYSAPHSDWASFPSQFEVAKLEAGANAAAATPPPASATPAATTSSAQTASKNTPSQLPAPTNNTSNSSMNKDSVPPPPPPMYVLASGKISVAQPNLVGFGVKVFHQADELDRVAGRNDQFAVSRF